MISFKNIYKEYNEVLFENFSMDIEEGIITALIAPSGSGKTTLMNMLMGFAEPDSGKIEGIVNKSISAVFQEDRLLESFSVRENMAVCGCAEKELDYVASLLDIKDCLNMYPNELSGGMRRRTAIGRCLLKKADIYIMDEPFKGTDQKLKNNIMKSVRKYIKGKTCIFVTHDIWEAKEFADKIKIFSKEKSKTKAILCEKNASEIDLYFMEMFKNGEI